MCIHVYVLHVHTHIHVCENNAIETSGLTRLLLVKAHVGWRWGSRHTQYVLIVRKI